MRGCPFAVSFVGRDGTRRTARRASAQHRRGVVCWRDCVQAYDFATIPVASLVLTVCLVLMLFVEPILWRWRIETDLDGMVEDERARVDKLRPFYTNCCTTAMFLYYLPIVFFLFSNRFSAFVPVCCWMLSWACFSSR